MRVINSLRKDVVGGRRSCRTQKVLERSESDRHILTEDNITARDIFSSPVTRIERIGMMEEDKEKDEETEGKGREDKWEEIGSSGREDWLVRRKPNERREQEGPRRTEKIIPKKATHQRQRQERPRRDRKMKRRRQEATKEGDVTGGKSSLKVKVHMER